MFGKYKYILGVLSVASASAICYWIYQVNLKANNPVVSFDKVHFATDAMLWGFVFLISLVISGVVIFSIPAGVDFLKEKVQEYQRTLVWKGIREKIPALSDLYGYYFLSADKEYCYIPTKFKRELYNQKVDEVFYKDSLFFEFDSDYIYARTILKIDEKLAGGFNSHYEDVENIEKWIQLKFVYKIDTILYFVMSYAYANGKANGEEGLLIGFLIAIVSALGLESHWDKYSKAIFAYHTSVMEKYLDLCLEDYNKITILDPLPYKTGLDYISIEYRPFNFCDFEEAKRVSISKTSDMEKISREISDVVRPLFSFTSYSAIMKTKLE